MKAMTILRRCRNAEQDMRRIQQCIQRRRDAAESITARPDGVGGRSTGEADKLSAFVASITELEAQLRQREMALRAEVAAACVLLDYLPDTESAVLHQYYIRRLKLSAIARRMGYTEGYIRKVRIAGERMLEALPCEQVRGALPGWYLRERDGR